MKTAHYIITTILACALSGCGPTGDLTSSIKELTGKKDVSAMNILGARTSSLAMDSLGLKKGDRILFLTNAGHARLGSNSTAGCIDGIISVTGCTPGASNLGVINSTPQSPLWFALVNGSTGEAFYCQARPEIGEFSVSDMLQKKNEELLDNCESRKTAIKDILAEPEQFASDIKKGVFSNNLFRIAAIAEAWSHKAFSNDLMRAIMLHDHFCPGLSSGIMISRFLEKKFPLSEGESYCIIGFLLVQRGCLSGDIRHYSRQTLSRYSPALRGR
jgi:formylmethanofuran dehydrogenase subunit E-like metal-binding protein